MSKPNILYILAEDMCPNLGCYGDPDAITPNLDRLAEEGIRYDHVSSVGPVCSAARTALALGMYPTSVGVGNHRSHVKVPDYVRIFSEYMQDEGYFTAINKTDYNFCETYVDGMIRGWDTMIDCEYFRDSANIAETLSKTWQQRPDGDPFFFMHTFAVTHQSKYGYPTTPEEHRSTTIPRTLPEHFRDRSQLTIPAYHTDNRATREIWGQYHECITAMDRMVGETIDKLKEENLYEETIIVFFGDNGMGIPGGKFTMWDEGTHVPLIVRVPDKFRHLVKDYEAGSVSRLPVDFVDLSASALGLAGVKKPSHLQGRNIFNLKEEEHREVTFSYRNRIDSSCEVIRSVKDDRYLYIRNFYPQKGWRYSPYIANCSPHFIVNNEIDVKAIYTKDSPVDRKNAFYMSSKPIVELYDLWEDPDQMVNLADDKAYDDLCTSMKNLLNEWMLSVRDGGLMMEQEMRQLAKGSTAYDVLQDEANYPMEVILQVCDSMLNHETTVDQLFTWLSNDNASVRYWAVQGLYANGDFSDQVIEKLKKALSDISPMVQLGAAETLVYAGINAESIKMAKEVIDGFLKDTEDIMLPLEALECVDRMGHRLEGLMPLTERLMYDERITNEEDSARYERAVSTLARFMSEKWLNHFDYSAFDGDIEERLLLFRELREKNDLLDLAIG